METVLLVITEQRNVKVTFNFLASLINGNALASWKDATAPFNFLASLINGNYPLSQPRLKSTPDF